MKLINREIDALISKLEEERNLAYKKEQEDFKTNLKVIKLAQKLELEYSKFSKEMKKCLPHPGVIKNYWNNTAISFLKLTPKTPRWLPDNTRRDIVLASADSSSIEEVLTKLKYTK